MRRFCPHDGSQHLISSAQPRFYRPATEAERRDPFQKLYRHTLPEGGSMLVRRMTVANRAELITAFCTVCAESIDPPGPLLPAQPGSWRVVGIKKNGHKDIGIAA